MKFRDYYRASSPEHKRFLSERLDASLSYLSLISNGHRNPPKRFVLALELVTGERFDFETKESFPPKKLKRWINLSENGTALVYESASQAKECATKHLNKYTAIAFPVEFEEGYGVSK